MPARTIKPMARPQWTADTLYTHYNALLHREQRNLRQQIVQGRREVDKALIAADKAADKVETRTREQFQTVVASVDQLRGVTGGLVPRSTYDADLDSLSRRVSLTEIGARDLLPRTEFAAYLDRQEDAGRDRRRALSNSQVAIAIAVLGVIGNFAIGNLRASTTTTPTTPAPVYVVPAPTTAVSPPPVAP